MKIIITLLLIFLSNIFVIKAQNKPIQSIETPQNTPVGALSISPNKKYLAAASLNTYQSKYWVWIWNLETNQLIYSFDKHQQQVQKLIFCEDSEALISVGGYQNGENIFKFEIENNNVTAQKFSKNSMGKPEAVTSLFFEEDEQNFWVCGLDGFVAKFNINTTNTTNSPFKITPLINNAYYDMALSPEQKYASFATKQNKNGFLIFIDFENFEKNKGKDIVFRIKIENDYFTSTFFNSNGQYALGMTEQKSLFVYDIKKNDYQYKTYKSLPIQKIEASNNQPDIFYALQNNSEIVSYAIESATVKKTIIKNQGTINNFIISDDNQYIITTNNKGKIDVFLLDNVQEEMNEYVNLEMKKWLEKGKFEKSDAYISRTNAENQNKKAQELAQIFLNSKFSNQIKIKKGDYDADNETFKLDLDLLGNIIIKIPITDAQSFDDAINSEKIFINRLEFCFLNNQVSIKEATFMNLLNKKFYKFASGNAVFDNSISYKPLIIDINTPNFVNNTTTPTQTKKENEIRVNIPKSNKKNPNAVAVVIGNAKYQKTQNVDFAINDAKLMKQYLIEVMGFSEGNIIYVENATYIDFKLIFGAKNNPKGKLFNTIKPNVSDVFVYYSGHGAPDLNNKKAYFVPVEADPQYIELTCFETDVFYDNLAQIPAKSMVVVLDACFSGTNIYKNISPIVIKSKGALGLKNGALLASCQSEQVSSWYNEKEQSLFSYFFLKAIHNKNADKNKDNRLTLQEIYDFLSDNTEGVPYFARRLHAIQQNPVLNGQNLDKILVEW